MELFVGKWNNAMLAEWFDMTPDSFKSAKREKLLELEEYADFYEEKKKVIITKVYYPNYIKKGSKSYRIVKDNFEGAWSDNRLDTCARVSAQIYNENKTELEISKDTTYQYTLKVKDEFYGKAMKYSGKKGQCTYFIAKQEGSGVNAKYSFLTKEEEEVKKQILTKYYGSAEEKNMILDTMLAEGELSPEEFVEAYNQIMGDPLTRYHAFKEEFGETIGAEIVRVTFLEETYPLEEGAFNF